MGKIIVIGSQKGGVGKTTTTLNLAYSLREMGKKVLTVDFDSQANLTTEKKIPFEKLDSEESIRKWNRGELQVALIHPASAGHGLNLQSGGNMLIWFGLTWSLELYQQTVARLWRQGQTSETVVVQHIITAGTIDEDVMKALASKDMTQNRLIAAVKARVTHGR